MLDDSVGKLKRLQADVAASLRDDSHTGGPTQATVPLDRAGRFLHFWGLVGRFFWRNRCQVRASALAYTTLLALVPLLAVSLTVASLVFDAKSDASRQKLTGMIERLVDNVAPTLGLSDADGSTPVGPPAPALPSAYLEVDLDIHSYAFLARKALNGYHARLKEVVYDLALVVQGNGEAELPERVVAAARLYRVDFGAVRPLAHYAAAAAAQQAQQQQAQQGKAADGVGALGRAAAAGTGVATAVGSGGAAAPEEVVRRLSRLSAG